VDLRGKRGLLIDDNADMRASLRIQLSDIGLEHCDMARNVKEGLERLSQSRYDLIICDYNLGQGADGQQFLELVRRRQVLPLSTAFLMVTGETGYEQVATTAEYAPDDYLLKPFAAEMLGTRIARIFEKKAALKPIHRWMGSKGDGAKALAACDAMIAGGGRHVLDALKLKGELLLAANRPAEAQAVYEAVLQQRATPWAVVGQARAQLASGNDSEARQLFEQALVAYPNYLAAYDSLANLLEKTDKAAAQQVVEQALKVAPSTQRTRQLGSLALENQDFERAESAFKRVVEKDRTGFFKSHDDYSGLAKSCVAQGKTAEALAAVKDMGNAFSRSPELAARQAAIECQVQTRAGNPAAAQAALEKALEIKHSAQLDMTTTLEVAQACFAGGRPDEAKGILQTIAENHHENDTILARAQAVFVAAGLQDEGTVFIAATKKRMIKLNNDAVALAKAGQLDQAIAMLSEAADRLTNNAQIALNTALALLMAVQRQGAGDGSRVASAHRYILQARHANASHPKLAEVSAYYRKVAPAGSPVLEV
jgi:DNA-binding response OmpR family regulator/predicted negative regulator of RcsB-dependent stress response